VGIAVLLGGLAVVPAASENQARPEVGGAVPVTPMHQGQGLANNSPELAVDPTASAFVAAAHRQDAPRFACGLAVSGNGGKGWWPVNPVTELPEGAKTCYAPEVSFGPQGRLHYLFAALRGRGNEPVGVFLASSDDRGQSFTEPRQVLDEHNFSARLAVDRSVGERGRLYLSWLHATSDPPLGAMPPPPNPIKFAGSSDGGETWSEPLDINPEEHQRVAAPTMRVAPDGTIYVAYYDLKQDRRDYEGLEGPVYDGTWSLVLARSTDGGQTFTTRVVEGAVRPVERVMLIFTMAPPALAAGPDGRVCVGWPQAHEGHGDALTRCSIDRGESWTDRTRVNEDPGDSSAIHLLPQLAFAPNGRLDAAYLARNPTRSVQHTYYAASHDGGQSFADPVRVTSQPSNSQIGQRYVGPAAEGKVEFGSSLGLLARNDHAVVMWPDTRNSRVMTTGQDLFAARVTHPQPEGSGSRAAALAGGGLIVAGLLAGGVGLARRRRQASGAQEEAAAPDVSDDEDTSEAVGEEGHRPSGRRWMRRLGLGGAMVAAVALLGVLGWGAVVSGPPSQLPSDPPEVTVTLDENELQHTGPVPAGRVVFRVANRGDNPHRLSVWPLSDDEPPIGDQLTNDKTEIRAPFAGIAPLEAGETTAFAVNLEPDARYALVDTQGDPEDAEGRSYAQQGSHAEFRTPANEADSDADSPRPPPAQDTDQSDGGDAQESEGGESDPAEG
jgi:hypothetical protein